MTEWIQTYSGHRFYPALSAPSAIDVRAQNMAPMPAEDAAAWGCTEPPLGVRLQFWNPARAEFEFLAAFNRLHAIKGGARA